MANKGVDIKKKLFFLLLISLKDNYLNTHIHTHTHMDCQIITFVDIQYMKIIVQRRECINEIIQL